MNLIIHRALNIGLLSVLFFLSTKLIIPFNYNNFDAIQYLAGGVTLGYITISFAGVSGTESHRTKTTFAFSCILGVLYAIDWIAQCL